MGSYRLEVHVSPAGSPYGDGSKDYPTRTLDAALAIVRRLRVRTQPVTVWMHGGDYELEHTLELTAADSGITFAAWPGDTGAAPESVRVTGGETISDWHEDSIDGNPVWVAEVSPSAGRTLYVNGERVPRPRLPHDGYLRVASQKGLDVNADLNSTLFSGASAFTFDASASEYAEELGRIKAWPGMEAVIPHFWIEERLPIKHIDAASGEITSDYQTMLCLKDGDGDAMARFYLDGVAEELGKHEHEWLLDRDGQLATDFHPNGYGRSVVLYAPGADDVINDFTAVIPRVGQLVTITGSAPDAAPASATAPATPATAGPDAIAHDIHFDNVAFAYADWSQAPAARPPFQMREDPVLDPDVLYASDPQAASTVPGCIGLTFAEDCTFTGCSVEHVAGYAIRLDRGVRGTLISGCTMRDLGAGALACGGDPNPRDPGFNTCNEISDCTISDGGKVYPHAVAVLMRHGSHNTVAHNEISRFHSSAIACGWRWDYGENHSTFNRIEGNHIHHLGGPKLDWFGAIYTLGVSPGTVVRNNLIHDVRAAQFGGWGILVDPATSGIEFSGNVIHHVSSECLHIKTGLNNIVTGNLLAHGGTGQMSLAVPEDHTAAVVMHNVIVGDGTPAFAGSPGSASVAGINLLSDANMIWDETDGEHAMIAADGTLAKDADGSEHWTRTADQGEVWAAKGNDVHSVVVDPQVSFNADGSVTLHDESAWKAQGIAPVFSGTQGPRPIDQR
ncbi:right-handed parallel beta-helix repeat-containing protein [Bifidobacterium simiarum]|uniref:right-handed parallel beta-helix repeat-containing protein n=1 Tax=Bifidobacterium simiarum TaxID=2045441 RepID=UPI001BDC9E6B|nr:right-handed parallel beta-helix repeat-containing protein [Bifidobacterium simiarum]MBT1166576.1 right-handed parallel beta-helix repeat-containing protein [Bifidobacterium simiarum]